MADDDKRTEAQKKRDKEDWRWRRFVSMPGDFVEIDPETGEEIEKKKEEPKLEVSEKKKPDENY